MMQIQQIQNALHTLGVTGQIQIMERSYRYFVVQADGIVKISRHRITDRYEVDVNGKYFGVWDTRKNTFID